MATKKTKTKLWMEDGDDAHFDGNPSYKHHRAKKSRKAKGKVHKEGMSTVGGKKIVATVTKTRNVAKKPQTKKKVVRKRVSGK